MRIKEYKFNHVFLDFTITIKAETITDAILVLSKAVKSIDDYVSLDYDELVLSFRPNTKQEA